MIEAIITGIAGDLLMLTMLFFIGVGCGFWLGTVLREILK